jgi:hypothetical protein
MTKHTITSGKPVFPKITYIVTLDYNKYAFDTIEKAARFVDALSLGTRIAHDYNADRREDQADCYYKERITRLANIEAVSAVIAETRTPDPKEEEEAA